MASLPEVTHLSSVVKEEDDKDDVKKELNESHGFRLKKSSRCRKKIIENLMSIPQTRAGAVVQQGPWDPIWDGSFTSTNEKDRFFDYHQIRQGYPRDRLKYAQYAITEALREYEDCSFHVTERVLQNEVVIFQNGDKKMSKSIPDALEAEGHGHIDAEDSNVREDIDDGVVSQSAASAAQSMIASSPNTLGPPVRPCAEYLRMTKCGEHGREKLSLWKSPFFAEPDTLNGREGFLDTQITAIVWILSRLFGDLPKLAYETPAQEHIRKKLRGPRYEGAILGDSMGLGKTLTVAAVVDLLARRQLNVRYEGNVAKHHPILILTPNQTVASQWINELSKTVRRQSITRIITTVDYNPEDGESDQRVYVMPNRDSFMHWPIQLQYIWDETKSEASRALIIMPIDMWAGRTTSATKVKNSRGKLVPHWHSTFAAKNRRFSMVIVDEAHKVKNEGTRNWKSVGLLFRHFTLLISATPCMNSLKDLYGLAALLWKDEEVYGEKSAEFKAAQSLVQHHKGLLELEQFEESSDAQIIAGWPVLLQALLNKKRRKHDIGEIRKYLKYFENLAILRRSPSSLLFLDFDKTERISLGGLLPRVDNSTVSIKPDEGLAACYQSAHLDLFIQYLKALREFARKFDGTPKKEKRMKQKKKITHIMTIYRHLQIASCSMDVYRLSKLLGLNGFGTLAKHISVMRNAGVSFLRLAPFLLELGDLRPRTGLDYLKLALRRSPVLRYILHDVKEHLLKDRLKRKSSASKLLITEGIPMLAYYYELVLQFLGFNCRTFHSGLTHEERHSLIEDFNKDTPDSCSILIQMYTVGFAGTNLHKSCSRVLVAAQAWGLPVQWQTVHRVIRVGQTKDVEVRRIKLENSYHEFQESRQVEKLLPELGTRAEGEMGQVLVHLLNIFQSRFDDEWVTCEAQQLAKSLDLLDEEVQVANPNDRPAQPHIPSPRRLGEFADPISEHVWPVLYSKQGEAHLSSKPPPKRYTGIFGKHGKCEDVKAGLHGHSGYEEEGVKSASDDDLGAEDSEPETLSGLFYNARQPSRGWQEREDADFFERKTREMYYEEYKSLHGSTQVRFNHEKNFRRRVLSYANRSPVPQQFMAGIEAGLQRTSWRPKPTVWTINDLQKTEILEWALELNLRVRLGTGHISMLPHPQISFALANQNKCRRLKKLFKTNLPTAQDIEAAQERQNSKGKQGTKDMFTGIDTECSLEEMDRAWKERNCSHFTKKMKSHDMDEDDDVALETIPDFSKAGDVGADGEYEVEDEFVQQDYEDAGDSDSSEGLFVKQAEPATPMTPKRKRTCDPYGGFVGSFDGSILIHDDDDDIKYCQEGSRSSKTRRIKEEFSSMSLDQQSPLAHKSSVSYKLEENGLEILETRPRSFRASPTRLSHAKEAPKKVPIHEPIPVRLKRELKVEDRPRLVMKEEPADPEIDAGLLRKWESDSDIEILVEKPDDFPVK